MANINADGAAVVADGITAAGGNAIAIACDVSDEGPVNAMFAAVMNKYGHVDVLVNNAALVSSMKHFLLADKTWWDRIIAVNLTGVFLCRKAAAPMMVKQGSGRRRWALCRRLVSQMWGNVMHETP